MATNRLYGAGSSDDQVDIPTLYLIAQYCDEMVPDGNGARRATLVLNVSIDTREDAWSLFNKMYCGRGMHFWANGQISFSQDRPTPVTVSVGSRQHRKRHVYLSFDHGRQPGEYDWRQVQQSEGER